jgi:hypothetical protein
MEQHHMLASGIPSTTEHFNGISEKAGHESCNLATLPYTYGIMLRVTGKVEWADKIEKAVFNAGLGAITKDFKAHQYFSAPNQMISTTHAHHFGYYPSFMAYCPGHIVSCCTGNINRMMPYYAMQMWLKTKNNGIAAALFGPSEISAYVGEKNTPVSITQTTRYPFEETIAFEIQTENRAAFEFLIRIPGWCSNPEISLNGKELKEEPVPGSFYSIERTFSDGDVIKLSIPMEIKTVEWPNNGISVERGPVVYSFPVRDSSVVAGNYEKSTDAFPAYDLYPVGTWQYSLQISNLQDVKINLNEEFAYPWDPDVPPVTLQVPSKRVNNWDLEPVQAEAGGPTHHLITGFPDQPELAGETETIELIPYGCTKLRVTVFPQALAAHGN